MKHYNYIFTGAGLSALMTVYEMIKSGKFADKTILLIDADLKKTNDRTWCFWDKDESFESIVFKKWNHAWFINNVWTKKLNLNPYKYKMIRGLDFYEMVFSTIKNHTNIVFENQKVVSFCEKNSICEVITASDNFTCDQIFNSIFDVNNVKNQTKYPLLQQHFIGWFIKSATPVFDDKVVTFMDFSVKQNNNTRFMYVLPSSAHEALIEYTLFSKDLLQDAEYENEIKKYLRNLGVTDYQIIEKEKGNIPMTGYKFWEKNSKNIVHIGSNGGWTKASTGFTFKNVTKLSKKLITFLETNSDFRKFHQKDKFWFYDLLFIDVLYKNNELGSQIFSSLFKKGNPTLILRFLDGETSFSEDIQVMLKCPKLPFMKALFKRLF